MSTNGYRIKADKIADYASVFYNSGRTPLFIGPPGIAKTAFVRVAAKELAAQRGIEFLPVRELHLASMSEVDVRGYLIPDGDKAVFTKPEFWATVEAHPEGGILFLDEFVQATHEVQKAIAPLILEGRIGEYVLPPTWRVFLAGNGLADGAGANTLLSHIINRVVIVEVEAPDADVWMVWAAGEGNMPSELIAFAMSQPAVVFEPDVSQLGPDEPFCTPRSLHAVGDLANAFPGGVEGMVSDPVGMAFMSGAIGTAAASALAVFIRMAISLPSYDDIVNKPLQTIVPDRVDQQYAMVIMIACRAKHEDLQPLMQYLTRFDNNMILTGLAALTRRDKTMTHNQYVLAWIMANQTLLGKFAKYISKAVRAS
jgi:hypothetical protein